MLMGTAAYIILLLILGWRMPGSVKKGKKQDDSRFSKQKAWVVLGYHVSIAILITLGFMFVNYAVRGVG